MHHCTLGDHNFQDEKISLGYILTENPSGFVFDVYSSMITLKCNSDHPNSIHTLSCFFYEILCSSGGYEGASRWVKVIITYF